MTLAQLLVVQAHDTTIDQLLHRRETLSEFATIAMIDEERAHLDAQRVTLDEQRNGHQRDQRRLEDEVALIEDRYSKDSVRLYSGTVTAHKDLEAIQHELATLERRQRALEDQVLDVMELAEPVIANVEAVDAKLADAQERRDLAEASLAANQTEIANLLAAEHQQREASIEGVDQDLLDHYEKARAACGGVGASRLVNKTCEGCHLQLSAVDFDRIRKQSDDAIAWCDCGRILVRE